MSKMVYEAYKDGVTVAVGTAEELADFFKVSRQRIGNCERTGRKIHGEYEIERQEVENGKRI